MQLYSQSESVLIYVFKLANSIIGNRSFDDSSSNGMPERDRFTEPGLNISHNQLLNQTIRGNKNKGLALKIRVSKQESNSHLGSASNLM